MRDSVEYIMNLDASAQVLKDLYAKVGWDYAGWNKLLDADLVSRMGGKYNYDKVIELLRFIRNVISHYGEFPPEIQVCLSPYLILTLSETQTKFRNFIRLS